MLGLVAISAFRYCAEGDIFLIIITITLIVIITVKVIGRWVRVA